MLPCASASCREPAPLAPTGRKLNGARAVLQQVAAAAVTSFSGGHPATPCGKYPPYTCLVSPRRRRVALILQRHSPRQPCSPWLGHEAAHVFLSQQRWEGAHLMLSPYPASQPRGARSSSPQPLRSLGSAFCVSFNLLLNYPYKQCLHFPREAFPADPHGSNPKRV